MARWDAVIAREGQDGETYFTKIGAMFENKSGNGFTLVLDALPIPDREGSVRVSLMEPREREDGGGRSRGGGRGRDDDRRPAARGRGREDDRRPASRDRDPPVTSGRRAADRLADPELSDDIPF